MALLDEMRDTSSNASIETVFILDVVVVVEVRFLCQEMKTIDWTIYFFLDCGLDLINYASVL